MKAQIPKQIVFWLKSLNKIQKNLHPIDYNKIDNGIIVYQLLKILKPNVSIKIKNQMDQQSLNTVWTFLQSELNTLNIKLSNYQKKRIILGNLQQVVNLIKKIKLIIQKSSIKTHKPINSDEIDLNRINLKKPINQVNNVLEMILLILVQNFPLNITECISLLASNGKYLGLLIKNGIKDDFSVINKLYLEFDKNIDRLIYFNQNNQQNNLDFIYKILKQGLVSKNENINTLCFQFFTHLLQKNQPKNSVQILRQYLIQNLLILAKINDNFIEKTANIIIETTKLDEDFAQIILQSKELNPIVMNVFLKILEIAYSRNMKLYQIERIQELVDESLRLINIKFSLSFQIVLYIIKYHDYQINEIQLLQFLDNINPKELMQDIKPKQNICNNEKIVYLFEILKAFADKKNKLASSIYKKILHFLQYIVDQDQIQLLLSNLLLIFKQYPSIPYIRFLQTYQYCYNQNQIFINHISIQIFDVIISNSNLDIQNIIKILDILSIVFLENMIYGEQLLNLIVDSFKRIMQSEIVKSPIKKLIKLILPVYYKNQKQIHFKNMSSQQSFNQQNFIKYQNIVIYKILDALLKLNNTIILLELLPDIAYLIKYLPVQKPILFNLLRYYGQPQQVLQKFFKQHQTQQKIAKQQKKSRVKSQVLINNMPSLNINKEEKKNIVKGISKSSKRIITNISANALKGLEKYQESYRQKRQKQENQQNNKIADQLRKKEQKKKIELKLLQNGYTFKKNQQIGLLFQFGSKQNSLKMRNFKQIVYIDEELYEDRDIKAIQYILKKYHKVLRYFYIKYSNTHNEGKAKNFDELYQKQQKIKSSEIWKIFKDHELEQFLTIFECQQIIKVINYRFNNKVDPGILDFMGFQRFFVQVSQFIFSKPLRNLIYKPPSILLEELFKMFREKCHKSLTNKQLFDDPSALFFNESDYIKELNKKLSINPNYILPQGYKKIVEQKVQFQYKLETKIINNKIKDIIQIVDQIIYNSLDIHIIEPMAKVNIKSLARPMFISVTQRKTQNIEDNSINIAIIHKTQLQSKKISSFLKNQIFKYPYKQRGTVLQVALVLEQIMIAVQAGHNQLGLKKQNLAIKLMKQKQLQKQKQRQQMDRKRRERQEELRKQIIELREKQIQKLNQQRRQKKQQQQAKQKKRQNSMKQKIDNNKQIKGKSQAKKISSAIISNKKNELQSISNLKIIQKNKIIGKISSKNVEKHFSKIANNIV